MICDALKITDFTGSVAAIAASVAAIFSAISAWRNLQGQWIQRELTKQLSESQQELTKELNSAQRELESRRFIAQLWDRMSVRAIDTASYNDKQKAVIPDLVKALNGLEFVAICWDAKIVNQDMVFLVFHKSYIDLYDQIKGITTPINAPNNPGINNQIGSKLLSNTASVDKVYKDLVDERDKRNSM